MGTEIFLPLIELGASNLPAAVILAVVVIFGVALWQWIKNAPARNQAENDLSKHAASTIMGLLDRMKEDLSSAQIELARTRIAVRHLHDICRAVTPEQQARAIAQAEAFLQALDTA